MMTKTLTLTQTECDLLEDILLYAMNHFESDDVAAGERFRDAIMGILSRLDAPTLLECDATEGADAMLAWLRELTPTVTH